MRLSTVYAISILVHRPSGPRWRNSINWGVLSPPQPALWEIRHYVAHFAVGVNPAPLPRCVVNRLRKVNGLTSTHRAVRRVVYFVIKDEKQAVVRLGIVKEVLGLVSPASITSSKMVGSVPKSNAASKFLTVTILVILVVRALGGLVIHAYNPRCLNLVKVNGVLVVADI